MGVSDQFFPPPDPGEEGLVVQPSELLIFCNPARKVTGDGEVFEISNPEAHLTCYDIARKISAGKLPTVTYADQFATADLDLLGPNIICAPATKEVVPPEDTGACCLARQEGEENSCELVTEDECADLGGEFQGAGVSCKACEIIKPKVGGCCIDGECSLLTLDECVASKGVPTGTLDCRVECAVQVP